MWIEWTDHSARSHVFCTWKKSVFFIFSWLTSILDMSTKVISWVHNVRNICCSCLPRWRNISSCYWCQSSACPCSALYVYLSEGSVVHVFHTGVSSVYVYLNDLNIVHGFLARVSIGIIPWQTFLVVLSMSWSDFCVSQMSKLQMSSRLIPIITKSIWMTWTLALSAWMIPMLALPPWLVLCWPYLPDCFNGFYMSFLSLCLPFQCQCAPSLPVWSKY